MFLAFDFEITLDITKDLSNFLEARIYSFMSEPEMLRNYLGDDNYEEYLKVKEAANRRFENLEGLLPPDVQYLLEDFEMKLAQKYSLLEKCCYKQGLSDGIKLAGVIRTGEGVYG